jgi:osmotically inducible protein OsmC
MPTRHASARWDGGLKGGKGSFEGESGAISGAYSFVTRFEDAQTGTNPEELLAAAEAACFSMALSAGLEAAGTPAEQVRTSAACTVRPQPGGGFAVTTMALTVRARVPGIDAETFRKAAEATKEGCPISKVMKGNVEITLDAQLEG